VQIRRVDGNEAMLLPPDQAYFLRENLRLRLLSARLALLAQDEAAFQADLRRGVGNAEALFQYP
jgi:uroporphyrin-III C-methyltransferase